MKTGTHGDAGGRTIRLQMNPSRWKKAFKLYTESLAFIPAQKSQRWLRVLDWENDLTMENLQWLQMRASIKGPRGQPEHDYDRDNNHPLLSLFFFFFLSTV